jgi:hypothetical protein
LFNKERKNLKSRATAGLQFGLEEKVLRMHFEYKLLWYKKIAIFNAEVWPVELAS